MTWAGSYRATPAVQNFSASATSYAVTAASGIVAGDLILLWVAAGAASDNLSCPGFASYSSIVGTLSSQLLVRRADGTEGSTFTVTGSSSTGASIAQAVIAGPCSIDVVGAGNGLGSSGNTAPSATGLTVAGSNELLLWFGSAYTTGTNYGSPITPPSGFTSRVAGSSASQNYSDVLLCDNTTVASGATGTETGSTAATSWWQTQMVAIKPVAYTGPVYRATPAVQNFTAASTTFAVTKQTGVVAGDLILLWAAGAYTAATFTCPGFTAYTASGTVVDAQLLARTANGTEGSTFTLTSSTTTDDVAVTQVTIA